MPKNVMKKLYVVPLVHEYSPPAYLKASLKIPEVFFQEAGLRVNNLMKRVSEALKDEKIDAVFCESIFRSYSVKDIINPSFLGPTHRGVYEIAKEKNARIEKTEDKKFNYFHGKWIPIETILKDIPFLGRTVRNVDYQIRKRRDYEMGKNVSERLKDGESGIIFHGPLHRPARYIRTLSPGTIVESLFKEDEFFLE